MGVAMIMVILYHLFCFDQSTRLWTIFYPGFMGVDVFLFLSGFGLCHSLSKNSVKVFYLHRFVRIFPMFLILALSASIIYLLQGNILTYWDWICNLTSLSYYGIGGCFTDWYLCSLILIYISFPFVFSLLSWFSKTEMLSNGGGYFVHHAHNCHVPEYLH